ncbi:MAG: hypothetical protein ACI81V_000432 [Lentimonas sp.]|jgi:hypothetical protein
MNVFLKISLWATVGVLALITALCVLITRPQLQKWAIDSWLQPNGSVGSVQLSPHSAQINDLVLKQKDGRSIQIEQIESHFSIWPALFDQTLQIKALKLRNVRVQLPASEEGRTPSEQESQSQSRRIEQTELIQDALSALSGFDWLLEVEQFEVNGTVVTGNSPLLVFELKAGAGSPGEIIKLAGSIVYSDHLRALASIATIKADWQLQAEQKLSGGFDDFKLTATMIGGTSDYPDSMVAEHVSTISTDAVGQRTELDFQNQFSLSTKEHPLAARFGFERLELHTDARVWIDDQGIALNELKLNVLDSGRILMAAHTQKSFNLSGRSPHVGPLVHLVINELPLQHLNPVLPQPWMIEGEPLSLELSLVGEANGDLRLAFPEPVQFGPLSVRHASDRILDQIKIQGIPHLRLQSAGPIEYQIESLEVADRYGSFFNMTGSGSYSNDTSVLPNQPRFQSKADISLQLVPLLNQPWLNGKRKLLNGQVHAQLDLELGQNPSIMIAATLDHLQSTASQYANDYRLRFNGTQVALNRWTYRFDTEAGRVQKPSSMLTIAGSIFDQDSTTTIHGAVSSERIQGRDFNNLLEAFKPRAVRPQSIVASEPEPSVEQQIAPQPTALNYQGHFELDLNAIDLNSSLQLESLTGQIKVNPSRITFTQMKAELGEGGIVLGQAEIEHSPNAAPATSFTAKLDFSDIEPAALKRLKRLPVTGKFEGRLEASGQGPDLSAAIDSSIAHFSMKGSNGSINAFKLKTKHELGLLGAEIVSSLFKKQSINQGTQVVRKIIPYFENIHFDQFSCSIDRDSDQRVVISQLSILGDQLSIAATGTIQPSSTLAAIVDQPMVLEINVGSKDVLAQHLSTLQLLEPMAAESGFYPWKSSFQIDGTLAEPNTDSIRDALFEAAKGAFTSDQSPDPASRQTSPEQALVDEGQQIIQGIDEGLNLLNSVFFGN